MAQRMVQPYYMSLSVTPPTLKLALELVDGLPEAGQLQVCHLQVVVLLRVAVAAAGRRPVLAPG